MSGLASAIKFVLAITVLSIAMATLEGCAGSDLHDYATERNYFNQVQCNTDLKEVTLEEALERGCFSGSSTVDTLGEPNVNEGTEKKEDSFF
jgi:hypothetical protein